MADPRDLLTDLVARARRAGADVADAVFVEQTSLAHEQRLGAIDRLERSEGRDLGLRVLVGRRQAMVSSSDTDGRTLDDLVERALAMARVVPEDPFCGLAEPEALLRDIPELDLADPAEPAPGVLIARAEAAEAAALAVAGVANSEGASAGWSRSGVVLAASNGFLGGYAVTQHSVSVSVIAGEGLGMERDYDYAVAAYGADLDSPEAVGRRAGEQAVRRLGAGKAATGRVPVIFDPRVSGGLLRSLAGAITGSAIARGTSFLKDRLGQAVFAPGIQVFDDPLRRRGLRSRPFDGEGLPTARRAIIEDGVLTTWLLDLRSARQLGLVSTGHASRGTSSPPGPAPSNLYLAPGRRSPAALMADIDSGFYVTGMMGQGANPVTGDYSRGASGFWIEKGQIARPINEATIAGNLRDMFRNLEPADDLVFRTGVDAPTLRIEGMTVAGR